MGTTRSAYGRIYPTVGIDGKIRGYSARWVEHRKRRHATFPTKRAAIDFLAAKRMEHVRVRLLGLAPVEISTVKAFSELALAHVAARRSKWTASNWSAVFDRLVADLGSRCVHEIRLADTERYALSLLAVPLAKSTVRQHLATLAAAWKLAIRLRHAVDNPWSETTRPAIDEKRRPRLGSDQLVAFYAAVPDEIRPYVMLVGEAGTRLRETLAVQWGWIDVDKRTLSLPGDVTKSGKPRDVPLTATALTAIEIQRVRNPGLPGARVFPFAESYVERRFRKAADEAGLPWLVVHGLRHAVGTALADGGVSARDIRDWLGHASIKTTEGYINRASGGALSAARDVLEKARGQADTSERRRTSDSGT